MNNEKMLKVAEAVSAILPNDEVFIVIAAKVAPNGMYMECATNLNAPADVELVKAYLSSVDKRSDESIHNAN
jgi:hypothetical protein